MLKNLLGFEPFDFFLQEQPQGRHVSYGLGNRSLGIAVETGSPELFHGFVNNLSEFGVNLGDQIALSLVKENANIKCAFLR